MLNNPSTLYTQNQGIFDSKPYLRMGQQLNQQKEARDAALNKYNQTLGDKINGAGLNYDDIEGLDLRVKNFQVFFKENSKQINNGNTPENQQYQLLVRDAHSYVEKGKAKMKDAAQLFAFQNQKGNEDVNLDSEFAEIVHKATLPLDKGYEPANMIKVMRPPKTYDDNEHTIAMGKLKPATFKEIITPYPNDDTKDNVTKIPEFTKEQNDQIKAHATGEYGTNRSYRRKVDELVKDPGIKQLFSTVYKNQYGIEATHPEDFAIAYDLSKIQEAPQTRVRVANAERVRGQKMADAKTKIEWQEAKSKRLINYNKEQGTNIQPGNAMDEFTDADYSSGSSSVKVKSRDGFFINADGSYYTSPVGQRDLFVPRNMMPSSVITAAKSSGIDLSKAGVGGVKIRVENGVVKEVETPQGGIIIRKNMENYQRKYDTERKNDPRQQFGKSNTPTQKAAPQKTTSKKGKYD